VTKTVPYCGVELITTAKKFYCICPDVTKLFFPSSLTLWQNKLECLSPNIEKFIFSSGINEGKNIVTIPLKDIHHQNGNKISWSVCRLYFLEHLWPY
jgi:hypothetical protein